MRVSTVAFSILLACACLTSSVAFGGHKDDFTQILAGVITQLPDPIDAGAITDCGDEPTFTDIASRVLTIMDGLASCDPTKLTDVINKVTDLVNALPATTKTCLSQNVQAQMLIYDLGITGLSPDAIKTKVAGYVLSHLLSICTTFGDLNSKLKGGDFQGFGSEGGKVLLDIFKSDNIAAFKALASQDIDIDFLQGSSVDSIGDMLVGVATTASVPDADVRTTAKCADETAASALLDVAGKVSTKVSTCDPTKLPSIIEDLKSLDGKITEAHIACLIADPAIRQVATALGITEATFETVLDKVSQYVMTHLFEMCTTAGKLANDANSGNWNGFGVDATTQWLKMIA